MNPKFKNKKPYRKFKRNKKLRKKNIKILYPKKFKYSKKSDKYKLIQRLNSLPKELQKRFVTESQINDSE